MGWSAYIIAGTSTGSPPKIFDQSVINLSVWKRDKTREWVTHSNIIILMPIGFSLIYKNHTYQLIDIALLFYHSGFGCKNIQN